MLDNTHAIQSIILIFRFYDVVFEHSNASEIKNLTCGRVTLENRSNLIWWSKKENHWMKDPDCIMEWHPDGITCICKHVGTYALLRTKTYYRVSSYISSNYVSAFANVKEDEDKTEKLHLSRDGFSVIMHSLLAWCSYALGDTRSAGSFPGEM